RRQPEPPALGHLLERFLEALRRGDAAVGIVLAALEIADAVERLQHLFGELGGFAQDRLAHIGRRTREAGQIVVAVDLEDVVEQEVHVFHGGLVDRHGSLPAGRIGWTLIYAKTDSAAMIIATPTATYRPASVVRPSGDAAG